MPTNHRNHPLLTTLRRMSATERKGFVRYLKSELYTKRKGLAPVATAINQAISRQQPINEVATSAQLTQLRTELDLFLALEEVRKSPADQVQYTIKAHINRQDFSRAGKLSDKRQKSLNPKSPSDSSEHLALLKSKLQTITATNPEHHKLLLKIDELEDRQYLLKKLRNACSLTSRKVLQQTDGEIGFLPAILNQIKHNQRWRSDPAVNLLYLAYRTLAFSEPADRNEFLDQLNADETWRTDQDARDILVAITNDHIRRMNKGEDIPPDLGIALFRLGLDSGALFLNGQLTGPNFYNIIIGSIKTGDLPWANQFLTDYASYLSQAHQLTYLPFCRAMVAYEEKNLEKANAELLNFNQRTDSIALQIQVRVLTIRIHYDIGNTDFCLSQLDSLQVFISRHKELGYHRKLYNDFVLICRKLVLSDPHPAKRNALRNMMIEFPVASYRDWFLQRLPQ